MESKIVLGGRFEVTDQGQVYRIIDGVRTPAALNGTSRNKNYLATTYCENGVQKSVYVHRMVAEAFVPNPEGLPHVGHINGNSRDNRAENLEWCTPKQSSRRAQELKLAMPMASAVPCAVCGYPTLSKDGICAKCRPQLLATVKRIDRQAAAHDRMWSLDLEVLTEQEAAYAQMRRDGYTFQEIADTYGVSRQCVHESVFKAMEKNGLPVRGKSKKVEDLEIRVSKMGERIERKRTELQQLVEKADALEDLLRAYKGGNQ